MKVHVLQYKTPEGKLFAIFSSEERANKAKEVCDREDAAATGMRRHYLCDAFVEEVTVDEFCDQDGNQIIYNDGQPEVGKEVQPESKSLAARVSEFQEKWARRGPMETDLSLILEDILAWMQAREAGLPPLSM